MTAMTKQIVMIKSVSVVRMSPAVTAVTTIIARKTSVTRIQMKFSKPSSLLIDVSKDCLNALLCQQVSGAHLILHSHIVRTATREKRLLDRLWIDRRPGLTGLSCHRNEDRIYLESCATQRQVAADCRLPCQEMSSLVFPPCPSVISPR